MCIASSVTLKWSDLDAEEMAADVTYSHAETKPENIGKIERENVIPLTLELGSDTAAVISNLVFFCAKYELRRSKVLSR